MKNAAHIGKHAFEVAGLGIAPFRCIGLASIPSASLAAANPTAYQNAMAALPRGLGCGSCHYCGTGIMHNFIIISSDSRKFVVGSDCVAKTGDAGLIKETRRERLIVVRAKRDVSRAMARKEREIVWAQERAARAEVFKTEHAALIAESATVDNDFVKDVISRGCAGQFVSDKALDAVHKTIANLKARAELAANSQHTGIVGKRQTFKVKVVQINSYQRLAYASARYETVWIITMIDSDGNAIVSKSPSFRPDETELVIKATVKEHAEYKGMKQTVVQRVTIAK